MSLDELWKTRHAGAFFFANEFSVHENSDERKFLNSVTTSLPRLQPEAYSGKPASRRSLKRNFGDKR